ncbi:peptidase M19 [Methylopila jiangsuensis]|uniref:Peptidase M19 n=1 Tax=Methylopila jiangsuensis TaxID=586230 RepID=A0A9W6JKI6_9HYPH|nr:dipeptidase [Methylopila jiangsuensis]MDR6285206.1 membrane dipeptidase [Methylopila jiangsuensis]GLK77404.1 peptidase M19 [Methylopila jiangsuensis]
MTDAPRIPVFDGHNDTLLRLYERRDPDRGAAAFLEGGVGGHIDLLKARAGGLAGGLFAIFTPSPHLGGDYLEMMRAAAYDVPLPDPLPIAEAQRAVLGMAATLLAIEKASDGAVAVCRSVRHIRAAMGRGALAAVLHIEGAEAIGPDLDALHVLHAAGLRSLGPVWSRPTIFGHGAPFRFPSSPDTGPGLTEAGRRLVRECDALRVVIDLSHLNETGFWDVARLSARPLVATHSNAHAVTPHARNLTDAQLDAIRDSGGLVGLNFATCFLREDGRMTADTPFEAMTRHLDHLIGRLGVDHVGFGSDFDGAIVPAALGDAAGLPRLIAHLLAHGYDRDTVEKLAFRNWLGVLERVWGE